MRLSTFLAWLGGIAILVGILGLVGLFAFALDTWYQRHIERRHGAPRRDEDEEG